MKIKILLKNKVFWFLRLFFLAAIFFGFTKIQELYGDKEKAAKEIRTSNRNYTQIQNDDEINVALSIQRAIRNVSEIASPSVVNIRAERLVQQQRNPLQDFFNFFGENFDPNQGNPGVQRLPALGSGFVISREGYIVTNSHVVEGADEITVLFSDEKEYKGMVIGRDTRTDVAVIKVDSGRISLPTIPLGDSDKVRIGDIAIAIGNPFGLSGTFTMGVISARGRDDIDADAGLKNYIQTDASINRGNSGGPLLNIQGQVIGMNTAIYSSSGGSIGIGFAIPMNIVKQVALNLIENGVVDRGYLGVSIGPLSDDVAKHLGLSKKDGIIVHDVTQGGPAEKAGVKPGDVILRVGKTKIQSTSQLQRVVSSYKKGQKVNVQVIRGKRKMQVPVVIGEMPEQSNVSSGTPQKGPAFLGMTLGSVQENYRFFRLNPSQKGVIVLAVQPNSSAQKAGVRVGDVIQSINYKDILSLSDFQKFAQEQAKDKSFLLRIQRSGRNYFVRIEK